MFLHPIVWFMLVHNRKVKLSTQIEYTFYRQESVILWVLSGEKSMKKFYIFASRNIRNILY